MQKRAALVDRQRDVAELQELLRKAPRLGVLYGRRRVGKTHLLTHAWPGQRMLYFLAADATPELNRAELLRQLKVEQRPELRPEDYPSWRSVFRLLVELAADGPLVVVLDEVQYLMGGQDDFVSQLIAIWDRELKERPLLLMLSGSAVSTMEQLRSGQSPLYGRINWSAKLQPFDYWDAAAMFPGRPAHEQALAYGILGGVPRYLSAIGDDEPLDQGVIRVMVARRGEVHLQLESVIEQERGIRNSAEYRAVLAAVAGGRTELNDIAQRAGLRVNTQLRKMMGLLEDLELLAGERNFDARPNVAVRYRIADQALRFWYTFVQPERSRLELEDPARVWQAAIAPRLDAYMGLAFERICRQAYRRQHARWGLPAAEQIGRWEGSDRNRRSIELDFVARLQTGQLLAGEIKWQKEPLDVSRHFELQRNLQDLAASGVGWAHEALDPARAAGSIYFSRAGFSTGLKDLAASRPDVRLVSLEDLYSAPS